MRIERVIISTIISSSIISMASAIIGTATYYTTYVPSVCYGFQDQGTMIAAANPALFDNGTSCGGIYRVRCTGATIEFPTYSCLNSEVTVKIVDLCPGCGADQIDLSLEAFSIIASTDVSGIRIDYLQASRSMCFTR